MSIDISKLPKPKTLAHSIFVLMGEHGAGKTTLGARFPKPVILSLEDGLASISGANAKVIDGEGMGYFEILKLIKELSTAKGDFGTLVVDSVTALMKNREAEIVKSENARSINQAYGGYGAGLAALAGDAELFAKYCKRLRDTKGVHVVLIAHTDIETITPPDSESYQRWALRGHQRVVSTFLMYADCVADVRQRRRLAKESGESDRKLVVGDGSREIICHASPSTVAKNRFGISAPLDFQLDGGNPFNEYLGGKNGSSN